jgi:ABC-2 type transport system permease protein
LVGTYLGIGLSGSLFLAMGCFASSLTRSQAVASIISLAIGVVFILAAYLAQVVPSDAAQWQVQVFFYLNLFQQMQDFTQGVVDSRVIIFYTSLTFFFLFLTLRSVESRRWK